VPTQWQIHSRFRSREKKESNVVSKNAQPDGLCSEASPKRVAKKRQSLLFLFFYFQAIFICFSAPILS